MDGRAILAAVALVAAGCANTGGGAQFSTGLATATGAQPATPMPPPPKQAAPIDRGSDLESLLQQSALDTQRALDDLKAASAGPAPAAGAPAPTPPSSASPLANDSGQAAPPGGTAIDQPKPPAQPLLASPEPAEPIAGPPAPETREALVQRLAAALREHADGAADPWPDLFALAPLDPAALAQQVAATKELTEPQKRAILALPALLAAVPADSDAARVLAERAEALSEQLADQRPLAVKAELCQRVVGFGSYTAFGMNRFPTGLEQRTIVYVEVANLPQRELGPADTSLARQPGDRYLVDLTQETNLYNESGSLLALHIPEQRLTETSRSRRRDFFLVSQVTLPPSLSIGLYNLKVTVRDRVTGAEAEASIPIEIVAGAR